MTDISKEACEALAEELDALQRAVLSGDPSAELAIRVQDIRARATPLTTALRAALDAGEAEILAISMTAALSNNRALEAAEAETARLRAQLAGAVDREAIKRWAENQRQVCNAQGDHAGAVAYRRIYLAIVPLPALAPNRTAPDLAASSEKATHSLKPCPFCGKGPWIHMAGGSRYVWCPHCEAFGPLNREPGYDIGRATAIAAWNARAPDLAAVRRALAAAVEYMASRATASGEPYPLDRCRAALALLGDG